MNSYQRRIQEIEDLKKQMTALEAELAAKGNIFFKDQRWLGVQKSAYGVVIDGKITYFQEIDELSGVMTGFEMV